MKQIYLLALFTLLLVAYASALELPIGVQKILAHQNSLALSITFLIAFVGGILTFTSPCGFALLPTFFSYVFKEKKHALFMTAVFSVGLSTAFVIFGIIAGLIGNFFNEYKVFFAAFSGLILVLFGFLMIFNKGFSLFDFKIKHTPTHSLSVFWLGFFFSVGWTPCVGPILGSMVILSAGVGSVFKSALLFLAYSFGVSLPLLILSYFSDKHDLSKFFISKHIKFKIGKNSIHTHLYGIIGGILIIILGTIMFFFNGTSLFMDKIPKYLPWTMDFFIYANTKLIASQLLTSTTADVIGVLAVLATAIFILKSIKHSNL